MSDFSRRGFLAAAAAAACGKLTAGLAKELAKTKPNLILGVLSDIHIRDEKHAKVFEKALLHFRDAGCDGVIVSGDMADRGLVSELELVGKTWFKVFPDGKAPDGRKVENLLIYGNHDVQGHTYGATMKELEKKNPDEAARRRLLVCTDRKGNWERIMKEPWTGICAKQVKGYTFVGAHWGHEKELGAFLKANAEKLGLKNGKPFFYAQHAHPGYTCYGRYAWGHDGGRTTRVLSDYPNAVAFSGHSHHSLTDERSVWQGAFTSIGASSLSYIYAQYWRENGDSCGREPVKQMPILDQWRAKQGMVMRVYDTAIVLERREFYYGEKVGPDWVIPLDGTKPFDYEAKRAKVQVPQFAAGVTPKVEFVKGKNRKGEPTDQVVVSFPAAAATATSRVFEYEVQVQAFRDDVDYAVATKRVHAEGFHLPVSHEAKSGKCVFAAAEVPEGVELRMMVRPMECYGKRGEPAYSKTFVLKGGKVALV